MFLSLFLVFLLSNHKCSQLSSLLNNNLDKSLQNSSKSAELLIHSNGELRYIKVNGKAISIPDNITSISSPVTIPIKIEAKQTLEIIVKPANASSFLRATLSIFVGPESNKFDFHTSLKWTCNGSKPTEIPFDQTLVINDQKMSLRAAPIWSQNTKEETSCIIQAIIPKQIGKLSFGANDEITKLSINDKETSLVEYIKNKDSIKVFNEVVGEGDKVEICIQSSDTSKTLIGEILYMKNDGTKSSITSNNTWKCRKSDSDILSAAEELLIELFKDKINGAKNIWLAKSNGVYEKNVCCSVIIPNSSKSEGEIFVMADNKVTQILVNQKGIDLSNTDNSFKNWLVPSTYYTDLAQGDEISITVSKFESTMLPAMLAIITYKNRCGQEAKVITNGSWKCTEGTVELLKINEYCTDNAKWIWSKSIPSPTTVTCTTKLMN